MRSIKINKAFYVFDEVNTCVEFNTDKIHLAVFQNETLIWPTPTNLSFYHTSSTVITLLSLSEEELFHESLNDDIYNYIDIHLIKQLQKIALEYINDNKLLEFSIIPELEGKIIDY